jgi:hypothetical protein
MQFQPGASNAAELLWCRRHKEVEISQLALAFELMLLRFGFRAFVIWRTMDGEAVMALITPHIAGVPSQ